MDDAGAKVIDLIFGRWRSQILYTGVKLDVFDALASGPQNAVRVASELGVDAGLLYRLMRALGSLGLLHEDHTRTFSLTPMGEQPSSGHPLPQCAMKPTVSRPQGTTPGAMLDTPPQPLYTRAHVSLRTVAGRERRFL
jgi:hypothetical protein